ncbi:unnamed protein product [Urochloa humidicola]
MMPYGTAAEAEVALGRSMTWAEAMWYRYSAGMLDFWLMWHIALVYFVMYAVLPLPLLLLQQVAPAFTLQYKLQPQVKQMSPGAILRYMRDNTRQALFIIGPFPLVYYAAFKMSGIRMGLPLPSARETVAQLVVFSLVEDYLSYWLHRFLHTKWGYDKIHCVHHEIRTPTSFAVSELTLYAITTFAGPTIVPCHVTTHWLWLSIRIKVAVDSHSGYNFPFSPTKLIPLYGGAEFHDYHHYAGEKTQSNFGSIFTYCDYLYGTNKGYRYHKGSLLKLKTKGPEHNNVKRRESSGKDD